MFKGLSWLHGDAMSGPLVQLLVYMYINQVCCGVCGSLSR